MPPATAAAGDAASSGGSALRVDEEPPMKRRRYCARDWLDWASFADFEGRRCRRRVRCRRRQAQAPPSVATAVRYGELHAVGSGPALYSAVEQLRRELPAAAATDGWQRADALLSGPASRTFAFEDSPGARPDAYPLIVGRVIASESGLSRAAGLGRYIEQLLAAAEASVLYYGGSLQYLVCHESQHSGAPRRRTGGRTEEQRRDGTTTVVLCGPFWLRRRFGEGDNTNVPPPLLWALACIAMGRRVM